VRIGEAAQALAREREELEEEREKLERGKEVCACVSRRLL
jgi:hypothetical protein